MDFHVSATSGVLGRDRFNDCAFPRPSPLSPPSVRPLYSFEVAAPSFRISPFVSQRRRSDGPIREEGERETEQAEAE